MIKTNNLLKLMIISSLVINFPVFSAENKPDDFSATSDVNADKRINKNLDEFKKEREKVERNLRNFDDLDFNVYSHQKWGDMHKSHAEDIIVHYPDGSVTHGLKEHIEKSKKIFAFAPDTENPIHHVRIGQGDYTAVTGVWRGTFTKPMVLSDGTIIQPTDKRFEIEMATIARWNEKGTMDEEWLFYDDYTFMKQLGLLK
ncbi:ester cyclase [Serratia sp. UGAL515B_01]|uniref:ester cyclase n=1 Tax=Serratia sp. UGAL515B_01 TaxID=2986763 RepID=UPI002954B641|nr:ester cyclase [Serratia sp. UGAL515B_01]WON76581.1 ester cyclase [Serratia sp. UGAL515B_01]